MLGRKGGPATSLLNDQICWSMQSSILGNGKVSGLVTVSALQKSEQKRNVLSEFGTSKHSNNWLEEEDFAIWFSNIYFSLKTLMFHCICTIETLFYWGAALNVGDAAPQYVQPGLSPNNSGQLRINRNRTNVKTDGLN